MFVQRLWCFFRSFEVTQGVLLNYLVTRMLFYGKFLSRTIGIALQDTSMVTLADKGYSSCKIQRDIEQTLFVVLTF